ncbi:hypothetical protein CDD80_7234 [Ophiocordyceps camponoti-rufipedis]|uniref:ribonuclease Z n=1 Tax=Ophiocordyceps camponoti-rufipedis TaxID=2004952 RepID=A0A2C5YMH5_9HYPO|nr:hypothetical protein CDD80_7234 [Ophiocordyceps camponoti-rufipedis]
MRPHAVAKKHSTLDEALDIARQMEARRTLLTHFSQRYVKADCLRVGADGNVIMAYDMMRVRLGEFHQAASFVPAVQALMESLGTQE